MNTTTRVGLNSTGETLHMMNVVLLVGDDTNHEGHIGTIVGPQANNPISKKPGLPILLGPESNVSDGWKVDGKTFSWDPQEVKLMSPEEQIEHPAVIVFHPDQVRLLGPGFISMTRLKKEYFPHIYGGLLIPMDSPDGDSFVNIHLYPCHKGECNKPATKVLPLCLSGFVYPLMVCRDCFDNLTSNKNTDPRKWIYSKQPDWVRRKKRITA